MTIKNDTPTDLSAVENADEEICITCMKSGDDCTCCADCGFDLNDHCPECDECDCDECAECGSCTGCDCDTDDE